MAHNYRLMGWKQFESPKPGGGKTQTRKVREYKDLHNIDKFNLGYHVHAMLDRGADSVEIVVLK